MEQTNSARDMDTLHRDPESIVRLLGDTRLAPLWLVARVYVGWVWLSVGWGMLQSSAWMRDGSALRLAWQHETGGEGWKARDASLNAEIAGLLVDSGGVQWIARIVAVSMTLVGIALILGVLAGLVAFLGVILSANVLIAGSVAIDPLVLGLAVALVLTWKTAGWIGLDRWLLPLLGSPWTSRASPRSEKPRGRRPGNYVKATK